MKTGRNDFNPHYSFEAGIRAQKASSTANPRDNPSRCLSGPRKS